MGSKKKKGSNKGKKKGSAKKNLTTSQTKTLTPAKPVTVEVVGDALADQIESTETARTSTHVEVGDALADQIQASEKVRTSSPNKVTISEEKIPSTTPVSDRPSVTPVSERKVNEKKFHKSEAVPKSVPANIPVREKKPTVVIVIGMAGSGKTTFMQRLNVHSHQHNIPSYVINLDPGVTNLPYQPNIDIRDTVNYKEVMKQYNLGPNGGIMTSLNLFATRFDQVLAFTEKRAAALDCIYVDTPGQIEVFTWSASGSIITDSLASLFPTVVVYVVDTPRNTSPTTFMSNMMYACSIMYKTKLPFIVVFNKIDVVSHDFANRWMGDFEEFMVALQSDDSYMGTLTRSMALVLDEFYKDLTTVGVSAVSGAGMDRFFTALGKATEEYYEIYKPMLDQKIANNKQNIQNEKEKEISKLKKDILATKGQKVVVGNTADQYPDEEEEDEDANQDQDDGLEEEDFKQLMNHLKIDPKTTKL